jgi:hypothetical protein
MDPQNHYQQYRWLLILFLIIKTIIMNKEYQENQTRMNDIYHLLAFTAHMTNTTIPFAIFLPTINNTRVQHQQRPRTGGFRTEVFPYLTDEEGYNSFRQHFRITLSTFNFIVTKCETHPAFFSDAPNAIPVRKQIAIVLW